MKASTRNLAIVVTAGLLIRVWDAFGPFLVAPGVDRTAAYTPGDRAVAFGFYLLWVGVLAITYRRDPKGRMWKLLLLAFATDGTWVFGQIPGGTGLGWTIQNLFEPLTSAVLVHLVLAFPTGRLPDRADRWLVGLVYTLTLPIWLLRFLVWDDGVTCSPDALWCLRNVLLVARNDDLAFILSKLGYVAPILAVIVIAEMFRHWRRASPAGRRALAPVAFGMPVVFVINGVNLLSRSMGASDVGAFMYQYRLFDLPSYIAPALFLIGTIRARLARGSLTELALELGRGVPLGGLRDALARTLRDPTLQVAFAAPNGGGLVDGAGRLFEMPTTNDRVATRLERDGELLAVLVHDPEIDREDAGLVEAVGSVARLALENERLSAQVRAQLEEVRASRQRIVEAGDAERHRIERDLHDGAQQRLVALAMRLEAARSQASDAQSIIDATTAELGMAIDEVRQLARGVHPAILTEAGLAAAVESLTERMPIPVEVEADDARYPAPIEAAGYFLIVESLTNTVKHAGASHATVRLRRQAGALLVEVEDDGRGGADPSVGSGLRGLVDRVAAAGGTLEVTSPAGAGTAIRARLPLA